ncbi:MAG: prepilin-type N-terminal cleavage/methylation domain-containing protein [Fimbriimonadaceae bacterium]|nr:prepilin-type N-terminal cleavage/methylation domain-containing protein [Fimbriimonadaceae bacterium]
MLRRGCAGGPGRRADGRRDRGGRRHRRGFTLIELLVALTMLGILLTSVYAVFATVGRNVRQVEEEAELTQTARVLLGDLRRELASVYPIHLPLTAEQQEALGEDSGVSEEGVISFSGQDLADESGNAVDQLQFTAIVTPLTGAAPRADVAQLTYTIESDPETPEEGLVRRQVDQPALLPEGLEPPPAKVLTPLASSFEVRYLPGSEAADAGLDPNDPWQTEWQDPNLLPAAVEVLLGLTPRRPGSSERVYRMVCSLPLRTVRVNLRDRLQSDQRQNADPAGESTDPAAAGADAASDPTAAAAAAEALAGALAGGGAPGAGAAGGGGR